MPRIPDVLERESQTVDLGQGDFERLLGRRERKERNRRLRAGALGVFVALAMGLVLFRSLTSDPLPADPPVEPTPAPAPAASGTLAYVLDGDVYVADPDGSNAVKIAKGISLDDCASTDGFSFWAEGAMWSPDGRYLAYRRTPCPYKQHDWGDVVIADAAGNVLATFPGEGWDIGWSPDSTRVAAWDITFETVGVYGVDGARQAQITMPSGWQPTGDHDPAWLRDGTLAVDAVELPLDGSAARPLDAARAAEWRADYALTVGGRAISPDGSRIASLHGRSLRIEDSDGSGSVTLLTAERGTSLSIVGFSPEGDRILYSRDGDRQGSGRGRELWSIAVDGSDARLVVTGTNQGEWFVPSLASDAIPPDPPVEPQPAPAGALAYTFDGDIYVADPDGSNAVKIADGRSAEDCYGFSGEYWAEGSMWSPDGRYLAYRRYTDCSDPDNPRDVVISDAAGNVFATFPADGWDIGWSPDSTRVAVWDGLFDTIGVYGLDGARQTQLTMPPGWTPTGDYDPVWTRDGTSLVVHNVELPLDGGTPRPTEGTEIDWPLNGDSPDGSHTAYVDRRSLMVARSDGSRSVTLLKVDPGTDLGVIGFSPEGDRILFWKAEDLWSIDVDGSDARLIVSGTIQGEWLSR